LPVQRHVLSNLVDVEVKVSIGHEGDRVALGSLVFRSGAPFQLNSFSTASVDGLLSFQREVRAFLPPSAERTAREEAERRAVSLTGGGVPQVLSALWKAKGTDAIVHPRESMTFLVQYLAENSGDPVIRDLMKSLPNVRQNPAAGAQALQEAAQRLRERGDLAG